MKSMAPIFFPHFLDTCTKFLDANTHLYKSLCPSVGPSVGPYALCYFRKFNMTVFEGKKSLKDIVTNDTIKDDEVVISDVPPRYLLALCYVITIHLCIFFHFYGNCFLSMPTKIIFLSPNRVK